MKDYLKLCAEKLSISLTEEMLAQFEIFYDLLLETNKSMNLTAITEMHEVVLKHFIDSISVSKFIDLSHCKVVDVGTGAGFPGIPLAILYPETEFVLMDSLNKRLNFINMVTEKCRLNNVTTVHGRAEDLGQNQEYREKFDICVSRAVASLPVLLELCTPFVKVNGKFVSYKSESLQLELEKSKNALSVLHCNLEKEYSYSIPDSDFFRVLAVFQKSKKLEKRYPRQAGKPKRNPL
ncbi:MAG: 16S rRNA (guanine(527)-N(7))-methyltransferase RsmG [Butyribacter sp.]|nr:16S rRNA (guanine(527)-N(7))-methyltransferase RsmG [bacterium]MDY3854667.1 16S rRNA (guanine(527)-N(7))-methyltransferase RsmG [Butyribacter sp.]